MSSESISVQKKILMLCGISQSVITFRLGLINALKQMGYAVTVVTLDDEYSRELTDNGIDFYCVNANNRSLNPFGMKKLEDDYFSIIKKVEPDIVFTFMLKPNIFGARAAARAKIKNVYSMVEGAGDSFVYNNLKWRIIRFGLCRFYRAAFKNVKKVFFLNNDDRQLFLSRKLVKSEQCELIPGIGVDLDYFSFKPIKNRQSFLVVARLSNTKGTWEYCRAARKVKCMFPDSEFNYVGAESGIKQSDIQEFVDDGSINYFGTIKDVRPYYENCAVFVLPSYREGLPVSVLEAEAVGRAVITTDAVGCKDTVIEGYNGFLVGIGKENELAEKMIYFLNNAEEVVKMGQNSRKLAEEKFDREKIDGYILRTINA